MSDNLIERLALRCGSLGHVCERDAVIQGRSQRLRRELIGLHDLQRRAASLAEFVRANEQAACRPG